VVQERQSVSPEVWSRRLSRKTAKITMKRAMKTMTMAMAMIRNQRKVSLLSEKPLPPLPLFLVVTRMVQTAKQANIESR